MLRRLPQTFRINSLPTFIRLDSSMLYPHSHARPSRLPSSLPSRHPMATPPTHPNGNSYLERTISTFPRLPQAFWPQRHRYEPSSWQSLVVLQGLSRRFTTGRTGRVPLSTLRRWRRKPVYPAATGHPEIQTMLCMCVIAQIMSPGFVHVISIPLSRTLQTDASHSGLHSIRHALAGCGRKLEGLLKLGSSLVNSCYL